MPVPEPSAVSLLCARLQLCCRAVTSGADARAVRFGPSHKRLSRVSALGWVAALVRLVTVALWAALVGVYLGKVDGAFAQWQRSDGVLFCGDTGVGMAAAAAPSGATCHVDLFQTLPVALLLATVRLYATARTRDTVGDAMGAGACSGKSGTDVVAACGSVMLLAVGALLFLLEALVLPFNSGEGDAAVSFALLDMRGLHITAIVTVAMVALDRLVVWHAAASGQLDDARVLALNKVAALTCVAAVVHGWVTAFSFVGERSAFMGGGLFLPAWRGAQLDFRVLRSVFSALAVVDCVTSLLVFNTTLRLAPSKLRATLPLWTQWLLAGRLGSASPRTLSRLVTRELSRVTSVGGLTPRPGLDRQAEMAVELSLGDG